MTDKIKTTINGYFKQLKATNVTIDLMNGDYKADYKGFHIWIMKYHSYSANYMISIEYQNETIISGNGASTQKNAIMIVNDIILNTLKDKK